MSKVSIVNCSSYDKEKVYKAVQKAISEISFEIRPGSKVLLKPNVLTHKKPDDAVTTHPAVIEAVCRILKEKRCKIIIAESSGWYSTLKNFEICGIKDVADRYNAKLISLSHEDIITKKIPNSKVLKETKISKLLFNVDLIINMPKLKTHSLTKYTGAIKNLFGCIPGSLKQFYHVKAPSEKKFCNLLVDIYSLVRPGLSIMDGVIGMEGNGPSGGSPKKAGIILASDDAASLDSVAEKIIGLENQVYTTRYAFKRGYFNPDRLEIIGKAPSIDFKKPEKSISVVPAVFRELFLKYSMPEPVVVEIRCTKCGTCAKACLSKAITLRPYPVFSRKKCIHCYCCHELCPSNAIELEKPWLVKVIKKIKKKLF